MNVSELAPDELFADLIPRRQSPPTDKTVQSQITPRGAPEIPLPKVKVQPAVSPSTAPEPEPVNIFADLIPEQHPPVLNTQQSQPVNIFADLIPNHDQQPQPLPEQNTGANLFADLIPANQEQASIPSPILAPTLQPDIINRMAALEQEDLEFQKAKGAYDLEQRQQIQSTLAGTSPATGSYLGYPARMQPQKAEPLTEPKMPGRDLATLRQNLGEGIPVIRPNEFGSVIYAVENGQLPAAEEADLIGKLQPFLNEEGKQAVNKAVLTQQKLKEYEEQAAKREAEQSNRKITNALDWEASRPQYSSTRSDQVLFREAAKPLTLGQAFSPNEDRLNSDDPEVAASERAKQLFLQKESEAYPAAALSGMLAGNVAAFGVGTGVFRQGLRAFGKAAPTTAAGIVGEGAAVETALQLATRQEGEESKETPEIVKDRMLAAGVGATLGAIGDLALFKAGDWVSLWKDKRLQKALAEEATAAGYDSPQSYLNDLVDIEVRSDGLVVKGKREPVSNINYMEERANEITGKQGGQAGSGETAGEPIRTDINTDINSNINSNINNRTGATGRAGTTEGAMPPNTADVPSKAGTEPTGTSATQPVAEGRTEPPVTEGVKAEAPSKHKLAGKEIVEAPIDELKLSSDVPQFKEGANQQGVVEQLGGTFDRTGVGPIQVWVRNDGSKEVISGRHRLDLAKRSGEETIPAQYHYESQGFGKEQAAALDATLNIREGQGKVKDYVDYFKATGLTEAQADAQGILARATGKRAYTIANMGSDSLIAAHRGNQITDQAATRIASAAPNNEALQAVGIKAIQDGKTITVAENMVKAVRSMTDESALRPGGDMFGFDDSALIEAEKLARKAAAKQAEIQKTLSAVQGAAKRPELAAKEGVDVKDPAAVKRRIEELKQQKQDWQNWHTNPELTAQLKGESVSPTPKAEPSKGKPPKTEEGFDLTRQTEAELTAKSKTQQQAEAADLKQQQDLEARARADTEAKEFELGVQGSGKDVSSKQDDLLGAGNREQPNKAKATATDNLPSFTKDGKQYRAVEDKYAVFGDENLKGDYGWEFRVSDTGAWKRVKNSQVRKELNEWAKSPDLNIKKNKDGSITANGEPIPKGDNYVPNTHKAEPTATDGTLHANPVDFSARQMARSLNIGEAAFASAGGGAYGGISSDEDIGSPQWWLDVMGGASAGAFASASGRYLGAWGKGSFTDQFIKKMGRKWETLPYVGRGDPEIRKLKKQQQLMRQVVDRQTGQMGEFLAKNFTPDQRAQMADMIENRGIAKETGLVARQAQELDDFISYTSERMKELGMLPKDMETGGYLHRYYSKHLGLDKVFKTAKRQESMSGSYSIRRGTEETFNPNYLSQDVKNKIKEYDALHKRISELENKSGDLLSSETMREIEDLKFQRQELEALELREYVGVQDGKPHSFIFMSDEVPKVPGVKAPQSKSKNINYGTPATAGDLAGSTQPGGTDRVWSLRGSVGDQPVLWRDWTKAERTGWGEIEDAGYRFVRGQAEVAHDLSMASMFKKVSENSSWVSDTPRSIGGTDWIEVPKTKVHKKSQMLKYGSLAGKYVKPEVWRAIKHYNQPIFGRGKAATVYRNLLNRWKLYKTVYNPVSHFNNTVSNTQMYYMAGYSGRNLGQAFGEMRQGENSQYWREARDVGLFGSDWGNSILSGSEGGSKNLTELAERLRNQPNIADADQVIDSVDAISRLKTWLIETGDSVKTADTKLKSGAALAKAIGEPSLGVIKKPVKAATDSAKWLYQKEDELFKMAVFIEERKRGLSSYEAMEAANRFFFDYNDLPDAVRKMKDFPVGSPFISYTYLAIPAVIRNAVERPERMLALAAAYETLNYAGLQLDGELEDQGYWGRMDNEKTLNPPWMKGRAAWGAPNTLHVPGLDGYKLSLANAHALGNPFVGQSGKDLPLWPSFMSFWGPDPVGGNPFTRIPFDIIFNQDWKGSKIYSETASLDEQIRKSLNYAYMNIVSSNPLVPGSWHQQKILEGLAADTGRAEQEGRQPNMLAPALVDSANAVSATLGGEQFTGADWKGNEYKTTDGVAGSVGVKLRPYRPQDLYMYELNKIRRDMDQVRRDYTLKNKKSARGAYTDKQQAQFKRQFEKDMSAYTEKMKELENAYRAVK